MELYQGLRLIIQKYPLDLARNRSPCLDGKHPSTMNRAREEGKEDVGQMDKITVRRMQLHVKLHWTHERNK